MSVRINLNDLSEMQKKIIRQHLYLQPKKTNFMSGNFGYGDKAPDPVLFYWIDKPNNQIILPYTFANALLGKHINSHLSYPMSKFNFLGQLRDYQIPLVNTALLQLKEKGTTTLLLGTGAGKSIISAYLASQLEGIALILTNRETIQTGWVETFASSTDAKVWVIDSKMKIPEKCNVIITMDGKFEKIPWEIMKMVSTFVIDECHSFSTKSQVPVLLGVQPKYVIACTATLERPDGMHSMIHLIAGTHKVEYKIEKPFTVYAIFTGIETEIELTKQGTANWAKLVKDLSMDEKRNSYIVDLVEQNKNFKIMILSWNVAHVNLLTEMLIKKGISVDKLAGTKSKYVDSQVLIGTISKVSTGFDAKNVAIDWDGRNIDMLMLVGSTKSYNLHIQSIGRAFRCDSPIIFDIVDENKITKRHWNERRKNYEEMNSKIIYVEHKKENKTEINPETILNTQLSRIQALNNKK
jgi:superfamily II DNA or RNA helicase